MRALALAFVAALAHAGRVTIPITVVLPHQDFARLPNDASGKARSALRTLLLDESTVVAEELREARGVVNVLRVGRAGPAGTGVWAQVVAPGAEAGVRLEGRVREKGFAHALSLRLEAAGCDATGLKVKLRKSQVLLSPQKMTDHRLEGAATGAAEAPADAGAGAGAGGSEGTDQHATLLHHILPGIAVVTLMLLLVKKAHSQQQLGQLRERQRRRRTDMIDGVDGAELGRAQRPYHADVYSMDSDSEDDEEPGEGNALLDSPPQQAQPEPRSAGVRRRSSG